jgi:peptide/nickel transport system permease protein
VSLTKAILLRFLFGIFSLVFISFVTFIADELAPGDAANVLAGEKASQEQVQRLRHEMELDRPWPERYGKFLLRAAQFDFGNSYTGTKRSVSGLIAEKLPFTAMVAVPAIILASIVGILLGTLAAVFRNRGPDTGVLTLSTLGVTIPNFVLVPILVLIFAVQLDYLPTAWDTPLKGPVFLYLILPVAALAARPTALLTRLTRASMIDTMQQEFYRTGIAKGVPTGRLIFRHALRNAILPVITVIGTSFGFMLTGSFVIEQAFSIPGIGKAGIDAIQAGDMPLIQGVVLVTGFLFIVINLAVDLVMPLLDPRIREAQI